MEKIYHGPEKLVLCLDVGTSKLLVRLNGRIDIDSRL